RKFSANLELRAVLQQCAAVLLGQRHIGAATAEPYGAGLALPGQGIALRRHDILEAEHQVELRPNRADHGRHLSVEFVVPGLLQGFATLDARLQHFGVVQCCPDRLAFGCDVVLAGYVHQTILLMVILACSLHERPGVARSGTSAGGGVFQERREPIHGGSAQTSLFATVLKDSPTSQRSARSLWSFMKAARPDRVQALRPPLRRPNLCTQGHSTRRTSRRAERLLEDTRQTRPASSTASMIDRWRPGAIRCTPATPSMSRACWMSSAQMA